MFFLLSLPSIWGLGLQVCRRTSDDFEDFSKNFEDMEKKIIKLFFVIIHAPAVGYSFVLVQGILKGEVSLYH
jgi:hypothetical protein